MGYFERRCTKKAEKAAQRAQEQREKVEAQRQQYERHVEYVVQRFDVSRELAEYPLFLETHNPQ